MTKKQNISDDNKEVELKISNWPRPDLENSNFNKLKLILDNITFANNPLDINHLFTSPIKPIDWIDSPSAKSQLSLEKDINELRTKLHRAYADINAVTADKEEKIADLESLKAELRSKEKINHILPRICEKARQKLLSDDGFKKLFADARTCESVVLSIDIRRSTELMLKARKPELFSKFITGLANKLSEIILLNYGIFDKFTGDGILAFFPKFYSGDNAVIRAIKVATECHSIFSIHYKESRNCFNVLINNVGLGIGIDYGNVTLVNTGSELTVVGIPVVYACRMAGADAGETLLNQPAQEEILRLFDRYIKLSETEIEIKNEGSALAYKVEVHETAFDIPEPDWAIEMDSKDEQNLPAIDPTS